jgi:hypothetical protein
VIIAPALDHQVALSRPGAVDQQVDARSDGRCVFIRQRRLLSHDGGQVAVEGEEEVFDLPFLELAGRAGHESAGRGRRLVEAPTTTLTLSER